MYLLILEFLGTNELLVILVVALMLLGPRRLPQMSRKLGKSIAEFKRTSEEFKRTWEKEVDMEGIMQEGETSQAMLPPQNSILDSTVERGSVTRVPVDPNQTQDDLAAKSLPVPSVPAVDTAAMKTTPATVGDEPALSTPKRKRDWL